jgi:UDP-sugar transporter A1/2/3
MTSKTDGLRHRDPHTIIRVSPTAREDSVNGGSGDEKDQLLSSSFEQQRRDGSSQNINNYNEGNNNISGSNNSSIPSSPASPIRDSSSKSGSGGSASLVAGFAAESTLPLSQSALIALLYTVGSTVFFLLIRYSKKLEKEGGLKYDNAAAVFFIELMKWTFSVCAMYFRTGKFLPISVFREGSWRIGLYYAVPSAIYFIYNNFTFFNLNIFDPATYQVFMQTRVLFTGVLYSIIFHKHLSRQKWLALVLLTIGVASKYFDFALAIDARVLFMLLQASLSAFAGVYNEFLLKRDISMDVNEQNFFMYSFALVFNLSFGFLMNPDYYTSGKVFSNVSNGTFFWIVVTGATMGISASLVLKFINVIVKAFASATEVLITAVLAAMFLGEALTGKDLVACTIVMSAIYLYYHQSSTPAVVVSTTPAENNNKDSQQQQGEKQ